MKTYYGGRQSEKLDGTTFMFMNWRDRKGVALILVIGMLALMVVLGVTFSIYMRTERVAAGSFKNDIASRQLLPVALNRALAAINNDVGNSAYPRWCYLESPGSPAISGITNANAMAWIPVAALGPNPNPVPKWIDLSANGVDGRVGYLVVNCSGLLDVNYSGANGMSRSVGTNVTEIQLSDCPDVANVAALVNGRPYETLLELNGRGRSSGALGSGKVVSNFVCYSAFPTNYPGGSNLPLVDLSGDENALMGRHTDIVNGLIASGIAADQAEFVYMNLLDYVDTNEVPQDLGSACTESVPMFNEILVTNVFRFFSSTNFDMRGSKIAIESFYPFVKPALSSSYTIEYSVSFQRTGSTPATFPLPSSFSGSVDSGYPLNGVYNVQYVNFPPLSPNPSPSYAGFFGSNVQFAVNVVLLMHSGSSVSGPVVDATPWPTNSSFVLTMPAITVPNPASAGNIGAAMDAECYDPRFNWSISQWRLRPTVDTLGALNSIASIWLTARDTDGYSGMFVANRPLVSVSELTYLLRGQTTSPTDYRWNTIHLFDWVSPVGNFHPIDRVLDHFTIGTNTPPKGFVNPNSGSPDVLTAVFEGMPLNNYPDEPPASVLTPDQARALATFWADTNQNPWRCNFANLSDIGHATNVFGQAALSGLSPFQQESFIRNTAGLFNTRQQYFMILLFAQSTKTVPLIADRSVLSDVRAIAEVWRDPVANAEGIHPCVIRMVHMLSN